MAGDNIETGVDQLLAILRQRNKISIDEAAKLLKTQEKIVQAWVDFLVEEKVLGLEYKFTKPYIYINETKSTQKDIDTPSEDITMFMREYISKANEKRIPTDKAKELWNQHLKEALAKKREYFDIEARKRNLDTEILWKKYQEYLFSI